MNMETLISVLVLTALGIGLGIGVLTIFINRKFNTSIEKIYKQDSQDSNLKIEQSIITEIQNKLTSVNKRLEIYKEQSQHWYQEYKKEYKQREILQEEVKIIKKEVNTLRYIIDKMDGKTIIRDENENINRIRVVK